MKIGQYLAKLWTRVYSVRFFLGHPVVSNATTFCETLVRSKQVQLKQDNKRFSGKQSNGFYSGGIFILGSQYGL